jgi:hypothetical protein
MQEMTTCLTLIWSRYDIIDMLGQCFMKNEGVRTRAHTGPCLPEGMAAVPPPTAELWATVTVGPVLVDALSARPVVACISNC